LRGLHAAACGLRTRGAAARAGALDSLLALFGERDGGVAATERVLRHVLGRAGRSRFCVPGEEPRELPGVSAARVYVLGPPRDEELLTRSSPSRTADAYGESGLALDEESAFHAAALAAQAEALGPDDAELRDLSLPFDRMYRVPMAAARQDCFFQDHYFKEECDWRRIDGDWLAYACDLALRLDSDTNNTSLALAIELVPSGKVLLFPADAQSGSWLSWHDYGWEDGSELDCALTAADLLRRTVVYKVGHHASHNATPHEGGLELMESPELIALVPVDEEAARTPRDGCPQGWNMPFPPLLARLVQKTRGRVVRADHGLPAKPPYVSARDWKAFEECCAASGDGLFIELTVGNPDPGRRRSS
ncbi:MAG TPA: hypothetical protein VG477_00110, partial [Thermoanaerobaculia bacterium]|nr:hypothetical protein [Thermoanaerobaculia bacterium]